MAQPPRPKDQRKLVSVSAQVPILSLAVRTLKWPPNLVQMCGLNQETVLLKAHIAERVARSRSLAVLALPVAVPVHLNCVIRDATLQRGQTGDFLIPVGQLFFC